VVQDFEVVKKRVGSGKLTNKRCTKAAQKLHKRCIVCIYADSAESA
jgi:hypothetical protein